MGFREGELEALVEMAAHLKENATDVNDALNEVENYLQIIKNLAVEVQTFFKEVHMTWLKFFSSKLHAMISVFKYFLLL